MSARFRMCAFGVVGALVASLTAVAPVLAARATRRASRTRCASGLWPGSR